MKYSRNYKDEIARTIFILCQKRMKYIEYLFDHTSKSSSRQQQVDLGKLTLYFYYSSL